jgi:isopentenyldiphosphate isomerase
MDQLQHIAAVIALTMGAAWASGINLYAAILVLGLLGNSGSLTLPPDLQVLASPLVLFAAGTMYLVEFIADKIPGVDSGWDALHTFIRIPAGAVLAAGAVGEMDPAVVLAAALVGGGLAAGSHALKSGSRVLINTSPEPFSNWAVSLAEDVAVVAGLWAALYHPWLFLVLLALFLVLLAWLLPKLWRGIRGLFQWGRKLFGGAGEPLPNVAGEASGDRRRSAAQVQGESERSRTGAARRQPPPQSGPTPGNPGADPDRRGKRLESADSSACPEVEYFEIVDDEDRVIGRAPRSDCHGNPALVHRVAHVLVFNRDGALLLQKRSRHKDIQPGRWDTSVGGHLAPGEDYRQAALREMTEELGVTGVPLTFLYHSRIRNEIEAENVGTFLARHDGPFSFPPEEIDEIRFWTAEEIEAALGTGTFTPNFEEEWRQYQAWTRRNPGTDNDRLGLCAGDTFPNLKKELEREVE